jgi:NifB/MoaA-like Fe-S oxidoreductase
MPNGNNPAANQTLATDPNVLWRVTKVTLEEITRELGVNLANTPLAQALSRDANEFLKDRMPERRLRHYVQTAGGALAAGYLQAPQFASRQLSRFSGLDEGKLRNLLNEALDAGILTAALQAEKNANRPADAQGVGSNTLAEIKKIIDQLEGKGRFSDLQKEKGESLSNILTRLRRWGDDEERALAEAYLVAEDGATNHQREVIREIGKRKTWSVDDIFVALQHATNGGVTSLDSIIRQMGRKEPRSRVKKAADFAGAALTGDLGNPDYRHFHDGMSRMTESIGESAIQLRNHADALEAERNRPGPGVFGLLNILHQWLIALWRRLFS